MSVVRIRLAVGLVSGGVIAFQLALMRAMSLRFWGHFSYMVIGVALLGFGASGTMITLLRRWIVPRRRFWICVFASGFSLSVPLCLAAARHVAVDVQFVAWDLSRLGGVAALEGLVLIPFFMAAGVIGLVLTDRAEHISGHYAANLVGSGLGGIAAVVLMHVVSTPQLLLAAGATGYLAAAVMVPWRRAAAAASAVAVGVAVVLVSWWVPPKPTVSEYKMLRQALAMPGTEVLHRREGPLGRIDVVAGPAIHLAPGLSMRSPHRPPDPVLMILDGDGTSAVYDCRRREDWAFLDYTTAAVAYHVRRPSNVLIVGAGGGADIGLGVYHNSPAITALEMNRQVIETMTGPLSLRGGGIYRAPGVEVVNREARGYLVSTGRTFDLIQLPAAEAFGASGAGLQAAQESYLYTAEAFGAMLDRLGPRGLLCVTRWARTPPRDGLRVFDTIAAALRSRGLDPTGHLAMIRNWATVTVLASNSPITPGEAQRIRQFCRPRLFDLCWLPDMTEPEANRCHVLDRAYYFQGARALLGPHREEYLGQYLFEISATTDDRPYFFHFFRWRSLDTLQRQLGGRSRAYLELGYLMLLAVVGQAIVMAGVLIVVPLVPGAAALRRVRGRAATLGYFFAIGAGFMLLEMGLLQKFILYLAHPIYSAAVVIGGFLIFAGLGSQLSGRWSGGSNRVVGAAAGVVVGISLLYVLVMDAWLRLTQAWPLPGRVGIALATIAPLAVAMGHLFPTALRRIGAAASALVPWAWAVNGFASVIATVAAPLLAMHFGFARLFLVAVGCYVLAGLLGGLLPRGDMGDAQALCNGSQ